MWKERNLAFFITDIISVIAGVYVGIFILSKLGYYISTYDKISNIILLPLITIIVFAYTDMYNFFSYIDRINYIYRTSKSLLYTFIVYLVFNLIFRHSILTRRKFIFAIFVIVSIIIYIERLFIYSLILKILPKKKIVIFVPKGETKGIDKFLKENKNIHVEIVKIVRREEEIDKFFGNNYTFFVVLHTKDYAEVLKTLKRFMNKEKVLLYSEINKKIKNVPYWCYFSGIPLIPFRWSGKGKFYLFLKRLTDIIGSVIGIIIFSPFILLFSILIKFTSKGGVYFKQKRLNLLNKEFTCIKFRTMYSNMDDTIHKEYVKNLIKGKKREGNVFKMVKDPRITPIGNVLRKTSLDEIPQFFNVLKGDLSLVGPRPPTKYEFEEYAEWHRERLNVKQGITGFWQVFGRSQLPFDESVFLDIYYVYNRSFWMDLHLIFQTIPNVIFGQGAY